MIVFCATDAGPAEYLAQIIAQITIPRIVFSSKISSLIFDKYGIKSSEFDLTLLSSEVELIVCGSSLDKEASEYHLLKWAKKNNKISVLAIDHWTNFSQRLNHLKTIGLPNEIWVNDQWSKDQFIKLNVSKRKISVVGNPVLENITKSNKNPISQFKRLIFISEEMKSDIIDLKNNYGFDEHEVIQFILNNKPSDLPVEIKLHPSEKAVKYQSILVQPNVKIVNVAKDDLPSSACYIGMNSILLLELALKGEKVYTFRPNATTEFIGNQLGLTFDLNEDELKEMMTSKKHLDFDVHRPDFKGSIKKINHRIMELI